MNSKTARRLLNVNQSTALCVKKQSKTCLFDVCTLDETISSPSCPLPKDNVCVCVKDIDCQEIYDRFISKDQSLIRKVKNEFQSCGFESGSPKYCCPYQNAVQDHSNDVI